MRAQKLRGSGDNNMSKETERSNEERVDTACCASCGITEIDDVKLVPCECDGCDLVKYCGDECKRAQRLQHEKECKKRAAELRDELLFKQPEGTHMGDCPICCLPLQPNPIKSNVMVCCSKVICNGCRHANQMREIEMRLQQSCPFCREALPKNDDGCNKQMMKRVEAGDAVAICHQGREEYNKGYYQRAIDYYTKAAELGDVNAHCELSQMYREGKGGEPDIRKEVYHLEEAVIGGHTIARHNLGCQEGDNGNFDRAVKHWIIAATQGQDESMKMLMTAFKKGYVEKADLAAALRAHHSAVDAMKSPQREAAEIYHKHYHH